MSTVVEEQSVEAGEPYAEATGDLLSNVLGSYSGSLPTGEKIALQESDTRGQIALWLTVGYIAISAFLSIVGTLAYIKRDDFDFTLLFTTFGTFFGGPLNFVLGYYLKSADKN